MNISGFFVVSSDRQLIGFSAKLRIYGSFILLIVTLLQFTLPSMAQSEEYNKSKKSKPAIDSGAFLNWKFVDEPLISNNGNYVSYRERYDYNRKLSTTVIQNRSGSWKKMYYNVKDLTFSDNSDHVIFKMGLDSICILKLNSDNCKFIKNVKSFILFQRNGVEWVLHLDTDEKLTLHNLATSKDTSFTGIISYEISEHGETLLLYKRADDKAIENTSVVWIDLIKFNSYTIWTSESKGTQVDNITMDYRHNQLAFISHNGANTKQGKCIWYYKLGMDQAEILSTDSVSISNTRLSIKEIDRFGFNGERLFIDLYNEESHAKTATKNVSVDVWTYHDTLLQSYQLGHPENPVYKASVSTIDKHILRLAQRNERVLKIVNLGNDDIALVNATNGLVEESKWSVAAQPLFFIESCTTGDRIETPFAVDQISPSGEYLFLKYGNSKFYSFSIKTRFLYNISSSIPIPSSISQEDLNPTPTKGLRFAAWPDNMGTLVWLYDEFDIWEVDLSGTKKPKNKTHSYGRSHNVKFRILDALTDNIIPNLDALILSAFDVNDNSSGFFKLNANTNASPVRLTMGPYYYIDNLFVKLIKARNADIYLVRRESENQAPNYYWTSDFKVMHPISNIYPEQDYNWLTSELVSFTNLEGRICKGILYKPADFDPQKKYPVIINYYERMSDRLHRYPLLNGDGTNFSLPWFVSNGYIVFQPDIFYEVGRTGHGALSSVLGAANFLNTLPYVDKRHIGLHGHSYGGFETNYIVTHTNRFAAAVASSGVCDVINDYSSLWPGGRSRESYIEDLQGRMQGTLWDYPDRYLENSTILRLNYLRTPLLILSNTGDKSVPFSQGLEMFLGLRRLGKIGWMLQYDGQGHGMVGYSLIDFMIRSQQFYDYFLKNAPPPKWMIEGIPAARKGVENGLSLYPAGTKLTPNLLLRGKNKERR